MRKLIAGAWIIGSMASVFALAAFLFGCCVLPFHSVLHRALPICGYVTGILSGAHHDHDKAAPVRAQAKHSPVSIRVSAARAFARVATNDLRLSRVVHDARALRNVRSLGALRVDDDIGLHSLLATYLI